MNHRRPHHTLLLAFVALVFLAVLQSARLEAIEEPSRQADGDVSVFLPILQTPIDYTEFYVSKHGDNRSGRSWEEAWSEFDQIDWHVIEPGDVIYVDGGRLTMTYVTPLIPEASGTKQKPIRIELSADFGRDGQAIIFGGNDKLLPECGQAFWDDGAHQAAGIAGIHLKNEIAYIEVNGRKRSGFVVHGWRETGVKFYPDKIDNGIDDNPKEIGLTYIEIYNNGGVEQKNDGSSLDLFYPVPGGAGIKLAGVGHKFSFLEVHDNAADAIQSAFTNPKAGVFNNIDYLTLTDSWLYNQRVHSGVDNSPAGEICEPLNRLGCDELGAPHMAFDYQDYPSFPPNRRESSNWCTHSDGIQIFSSGALNTLIIDRTIIGPNFMNALILGDRNNANETAWVNNLTLRDVVITRFMHNALGMKNPPDQAGESWELSNVTIYGHFSNTNKKTLSLESNSTETDHRIVNSIMVHGRADFPNGNIAFNNNCEFAMYSGSIGGEVVSPQFTQIESADIFENDLNIDFATVFTDDYTPLNKFCDPYGSRIRSAAELLQRFE